MENQLVENFKAAKQALYDHVGFKEDWTVYAIEIITDMFWELADDCVIFAETLDNIYSDGDYYEYERYRQRFYPTDVYCGEDLTMIIVDTHVDGNKFFAFYSNSLEVNYQASEEHLALRSVL